MNFDVFISYPHQDKPTADAVCAMLEASGMRCWIAPRDVQPSADWAASIVDAIDDCRVMVLIFSSRANQSKQVHREVQRAFDQEKPVVPFRIENITPAKTLAYYMGPVHWLDALTPPLERHIETLAQSVKRLLGPSQAERPAAEAAAAARHAQEEARRRHDAEVKQRGEEEARRRQAETEARERADAEHRAGEVQARQRAEQERAFAKAKRADAVSAVDGFLAAYSSSHLADEAKTLRAALVERDDAHQRAMASDDSAVLKTFLERYPAGKPADAVRKRLRRLEGPQRWRPSRRAVLTGGGAIGGALGAGALAITAATRIHLYGSIFTSAPIRTFAGDVWPIGSVAIAPDGHTALSGDSTGKLKLWDLAKGSTRWASETGGSTINSVAIAADGRTALSGHSDGNLKLWHLATGGLIRTLAGYDAEVNSVAIAPDGRTALSGGGGPYDTDFALRLWNLSNGKTIRTFAGPTQGVRSVAITPDGRNALSASSDFTLRLWDLTSGKEIRGDAVGKFNSGDVYSVAVASDNRTALLGFWNGTLRLWDLVSASAIRTFTGHTGWAMSVAFSPDGRTALSGSADETLRLWNLASGSTIRTFTGHTDGVTSVAIAPDGRTALSGSGDGTLRLWNLT